MLYIFCIGDHVFIDRSHAERLCKETEETYIINNENEPYNISRDPEAKKF